MRLIEKVMSMVVAGGTGVPSPAGNRASRSHYTQTYRAERSLSARQANGIWMMVTDKLAGEADCRRPVPFICARDRTVVRLMAALPFPAASWFSCHIKYAASIPGQAARGGGGTVRYIFSRL